MKQLNRSNVSRVFLFIFLMMFAVACSGSEDATSEPMEEATSAPAEATDEPMEEATEVMEEPTEASEEVEEEPTEEPTAEPEPEPTEEMMEEEEKVLVIGHSEVTESYDLAHAFNPTSGMVNHVTYQTLVTFPESDASSIEPMLADSWDISDDGLTYTFNLRDDVTFANGDPLTADDVVFSFNRLKNVKSNPSFLADGIASVEAADDLTVVITLNEVRPSFLAELVNTSFSIANDSEVMAQGGTDAEDADTADTAQDYFDQNSAGSGPYMLESWTPQEETVIVRNPNYWGDEEPYFDRIIIVNISEAATQQVALESGDIDIATDLAPDQVAGMDDNGDLTIFRGQDTWTHFVLMNRDADIGGPVSDPQVALAVRYALDYEGYTALWDGSVTPGSNMWVGIAGAFGPDKAFTRDLDRSRELLAEAGYPDGFDIELSYPDFTFGGINLSTNAQKIQADLAEVGINVSLRPGEVQVSLEEYRNGDQGFAYWFWGPDILDPVDFLAFLPGGKVADERTNWTTDMLDQDTADLIAQAGAETDADTRSDIFDQLQTYAQENGAYAPFNVPAIQNAYRSDVGGYTWHPQWGIDLAKLNRSQ